MKIKKAKFKKILKTTYLKSVIGRLLGDVDPYIDKIRDIQQTTKTSIGFWALARMIFPVIDAVSSRIYKSKKNERASKLLRELDVPCPNLVWEMFRHSLMHGDQPRIATHRRKKVIWEMRIDEKQHEIKHLRLAIDITKCYEDFLSFLDKEIKKSGSKTIWVENEIWFTNKISPALKNEFKLLNQTK